jgi:hypothetical protein
MVLHLEVMRRDYGDGVIGYTVEETGCSNDAYFASAEIRFTF